jgi:hypothetical protein
MSHRVWLLHAEMSQLLFQNSPGAEIKFQLVFPFGYLIAALEPNVHYPYTSLIHQDDCFDTIDTYSHNFS